MTAIEHLVRPRITRGRTLLLYTLVACAAVLRLPAAGFTMLSALVLLVFASLFWTAAITPPPTPLADQNLLAARAFWFLKATWMTIVFGLSAVYSSAVAIDLEAHVHDADGGSASMLEALRLPILSLAPALAWLAAMWIAVDMWRIGVATRESAAQAIAERVIPPDLGADPVRRWLAGLVSLLTSPSLAIPTTYLGPPLAFLPATLYLAAHGQVGV